MIESEAKNFHIEIVPQIDVLEEAVDGLDNVVVLQTVLEEVMKSLGICTTQILCLHLS